MGLRPVFPAYAGLIPAIDAFLGTILGGIPRLCGVDSLQPDELSYTIAGIPRLCGVDSPLRCLQDSWR